MPTRWPVSLSIARPLAQHCRLKLYRMSSTLLGRSGRVYVRDKPLRVRPTDPRLNVYLAYHEGQPYILKPVSRSIFEHSKELKTEFENNSRLRIHVDDNEEEAVLVYEYFRDDLLSLVKRKPELSVEARKHILQSVGQGLRDLHSKQWIHLDVKPDNVVLDWSVDQNSQFHIQRVALGDLECALKLKDDKLLNYQIGNVMWRSPEGQAGKGVGKPSEIFSFGLLCLYTITGVETLHPDFQKLKEEGTEPEHVILYKLLSMFGPASPELISHVDDEYWNQLLTALSDAVAEEDPSLRFERWGSDDLPNLDDDTRRMILRMTNLSPSKRATIDQVLADSWWNS